VCIRSIKALDPKSLAPPTDLISKVSLCNNTGRLERGAELLSAIPFIPRKLFNVVLARLHETTRSSKSTPVEIDSIDSFLALIPFHVLSNTLYSIPQSIYCYPNKKIIMSFQDVGKNNTHRRAASASMQSKPSQSSSTTTIPETSSWTSGIASLTSAVTSSSTTATVGQISESLTQFQVRFLVRSTETNHDATRKYRNDVAKLSYVPRKSRKGSCHFR
jgi:hypothetical protein